MLNWSKEASGGMTQIVSFVSGIIVLVSLIAIGPFFSVLPKALLSAVIAVNLRGMFEQFHELKPLFNFSKVIFVDFYIYPVNLRLKLFIRYTYFICKF